MGIALETESLRETLTILCDGALIDHMNEMDAAEGPQVGNFTDFGKAIEWGKRTKRKKHYSPDTMPGNLFDDIDHEAPTPPLEDYEGEMIQHELPPDEL